MFPFTAQRPRVLKAIEMRLKRLQRFDRLERLERTCPGGFVLAEIKPVLSRK